MGVDLFICQGYGFLLWSENYKDKLKVISDYLDNETKEIFLDIENDENNGSWCLERDAYDQNGGSVHVFLHHTSCYESDGIKTGGNGGFGTWLCKLHASEQVKKEAQEIYQKLKNADGEDGYTPEPNYCIYTYFA